MTDETKGDGETWEAYAHRLERRIKQQRVHLDALGNLDGHRRRDAERIAALERLIGRKSLTIDRHRDAVHVLGAKVEELKKGVPNDYETLLALEEVVRESHGDPSVRYAGRDDLVICDECRALIAITEARSGD